MNIFRTAVSVSTTDYTHQVVSITPGASPAIDMLSAFSGLPGTGYHTATITPQSIFFDSTKGYGPDVRAVSAVLQAALGTGYAVSVYQWKTTKAM